MFDLSVNKKTEYVLTKKDIACALVLGNISNLLEPIEEPYPVADVHYDSLSRIERHAVYSYTQDKGLSEFKDQVEIMNKGQFVDFFSRSFKNYMVSASFMNELLLERVMSGVKFVPRADDTIGSKRNFYWILNDQEAVVYERIVELSEFDVFGFFSSEYYVHQFLRNPHRFLLFAESFESASASFETAVVSYGISFSMFPYNKPDLMLCLDAQLFNLRKIFDLFMDSDEMVPFEMFLSIHLELD